VVVAPAVADSAPEPAARLIRAEFLAAATPASPVAVCVVDSGVTPTPDLPVGTTLIESTSLDGGSATTCIRTGTARRWPRSSRGQDNGWGQTGVWPHAKIVSVRAATTGRLQSLRPLRHRDGAMYDPRRGRGVRVAVINLSLGQVGGDDQDRAAFAEQIEFSLRG
jgi:hypothetical protein